ncbi:MAG: hypothetical protein C4533_03745 [Candidatus Omnitrophota bacterium]|nr:MAG: hypothetical protein C4533_03745 [Candidatus Omnitrophota bacterium]
MVKRAIVIVLVFSVLLLQGCATAAKKKDLEIQSLRNELSALNSQLQIKQEEVDSLKSELNALNARNEMMAAKPGRISEVKSRPNVRQIQLALKNAGYNPGKIDGRLGRQTKDAIRAFQRDNNIPADGRVGKVTWKLLGRYLSVKMK